MSEFFIEYEWLDPMGAQGPELKATWARLMMRIDKTPLTRVQDEKTMSYRDALYLPLYPLAEWIAFHWWSLWHEPLILSSQTRPNYISRHYFSFAREGYALPALQLHFAGKMTNLIWKSERLQFQPLEFTQSGEAWLETQPLKEKFIAFIHAVTQRLETEGIMDSPLQEEWRAIQNADLEESRFCECIGALGQDPYNLDENVQEAISAVYDQLPKELSVDFFQVVNPEQIRVNADDLIRAQKFTTANAEIDHDLKKIHTTARKWSITKNTTPWEVGYQLAKSLRKHLGIGNLPLSESAEKILGFNFKKEQVCSMNPPFGAFWGLNSNKSPTFVLRKGPEMQQRFYQSRALCDYLLSSIDRCSLITDAYTMKQKLNRAFGAELLAPADALKKRATNSLIQTEEVETLASEFNVSTKIVEHQLKNNNITIIDSNW